jgi:hypothetical protein
MILCGWCGAPTTVGLCLSCGRDAALPWAQRATEPPTVESRGSGRPQLTAAEAAKRLAAAGPHASDEAVAIHWDVDPRTVRNWRAKVSG